MYLVYIGHCPNPFADFEYNLFHVILTFFLYFLDGFKMHGDRSCSVDSFSKLLK